jgi:hypothetical protein
MTAAIFIVQFALYKLGSTKASCLVLDPIPVDFEATASWCDRFARYRAIPEILSMPEVAGGQSVRLVDLSQFVLNKYLTVEQQSTRFKRAKANGELSVASSVKFYIPFIAQQTKQLAKLGGGMFRLPTDGDFDEEDIEGDAVDASVDEGSAETVDFDGWVYAFSFPMIQDPERPFPIKIGKTTNDVESRVNNQCKQSASFESPTILGRWQVKRVGPVELAVHNVLKARGKWREEAPGAEWFDTTINEIQEIIRFVTDK